MPRKSSRTAHLPIVLLFGVLSIIWTWPLVWHFHDHIPGSPGDNYGYLWTLWWMRKVLGTPALEFFRSAYLLNPFGADLINHPHTALQAYVSATALGGLDVIRSENLYIMASLCLNALCAYALAFDLTRDRRAALLAGIAFGGSPYTAAHLLGHFDLLTAWVIPLFALCLRRALQNGKAGAAIGCGLCVAIGAYSAYYYVVYLAVFGGAYTVAAWNAVRITSTERTQTTLLLTLRLAIVALLAFDVFLIVFILVSGGTTLRVGEVDLSVRGVHNPLLGMWVLILAWVFTRQRFGVRVAPPPADVIWRTAQTLAITFAVFTVLCLPLIAEAVRLAYSGRYVSQSYHWRSAPRGVDLLSPFIGNPFHPLYGGAVTRLYDALHLDRIEAVGWLGIVPFVVLSMGRRIWSDSEEARRWKIVLIVFALWALGPFLTAGGVNLGLPLPQALARFLPVINNARIPGRAMVTVYLALGVLMALRVDGLTRDAARGFHPRLAWAFIALLAVDYLHAPIPLTALERPGVYEKLASIDDGGVVIEVPFGLGDGLSTGRGSQDRRLLYHATIHGHPVMGGYLARIPPLIAHAYEAMPIVGNLLRLSSGEEPLVEAMPPNLPFRYLVLDKDAASPDLIDYVRSNLDMDLIASSGARELHAVHGAKRVNFRASAAELRFERQQNR